MLGSVILSQDQRRAVQNMGFGYACFRGASGVEGFERVHVGVVPTLTDALAFLDGKHPRMAYIGYAACWEHEKTVN